jgi:MoCo/4Fe-4S cofactor protein with predicted Tat translocation signal
MSEKRTKLGGPDVCPGKRKDLDLAAVKAEIEQTTGPEYWRSLEELAGSEDFQAMLHREFPKGFRVARFLLAPRVPEDHGRFIGAGGFDRLHQVAAD